MMASPMDMFVANLKSHNDETRARAARDLNRYVTTELREVSVDELANFIDKFHPHLYKLVSSSDIHEKKGGILAISKPIQSTFYYREL